VRVIGGWLLVAIACGAHAQSPAELLRSERPVDRAWGAYQAARSHDPNLRGPLLGALHAAGPLRDSPEDSEPYFAIQAIFDALLQWGDPVAPEAVVPFAGQWRNEVLLLLARGGATDDALLELREQKQSLAQWVAVNNLLYRSRSPRFFARTLAELEIGPVFEVRDTDEPFAYCGGGFGIGSRERKLTEGFPPIALYRLEVEFLAPVQSATVAIDGPTKVYVQRIPMAAGQPVQWADLSPDKIPTTYRERYLQAAGSLTDKQRDDLFHPFVRIYWESAGQVAREMDRHLDEQAIAVRQFVDAALPPGSMDGVRIKLVPEIRDVRQLNHSALRPRH
jgi:hypothetical protein